MKQILIFILLLLVVGCGSPHLTSIATHPRLGPSAGPVVFTSASQFPTYMWNLYTYQNGHYVGKGVAAGITYWFPKGISVKVLPKKLPTPTPGPTPKPTIVPIPVPTQTNNNISACQNSGAQCELALVDLINQERASHGYRPLQYNSVQSTGNGTCIGAKGHSDHMAQTGQLAHDQFPADICGYGSSVSYAGENIGESGGSEWYAIKAIFDLMMQEPWSPGCTGSHHCNFNDPNYTSVGIGISGNTSAYWQTEDFVR